jgi:hypothetical protein
MSFREVVMEKSPRDERIESLLRSSKIVADGFLGFDERPLQEIIDADVAELERLGYTAEKVAEKMRQLTEAAKPMLGNPAQVDGLIVTYEDFKGAVVCPWPHPGRFAKAITMVRRAGSEQTIKWSDLNIHMIAEHGFFEGKGSAFRIEPMELVKIIFGE